MAATRIIIRPNYLFRPRINFVLSGIRGRAEKFIDPAILIIIEMTIYRATRSDFSGLPPLEVLFFSVHHVEDYASYSMRAEELSARQRTKKRGLGANG